ncbi:MAG TPA: hypothetical protein VNN72_27875 [Polyangiaceae bacterium]|jgi:hypothetical protein|nr:hypothetical protein [Polyangiaceae bacterium]
MSGVDAGTFATLLVSSMSLGVTSCCSLQSGAEIKDATSHYRAGDTVVLRVENGESHPLSGINNSNVVALERFDGGAWRSEPRVWHDAEYEERYDELPPCTAAERVLQLPRHLKPGRYRIAFEHRFVTRSFEVRP